MPFVSVGDLSVFYERQGNGAPLLFISGTGSDLRVRPGALDGPLPRRFDVLAYDQRGLGQTSKPDISYTMADYADDAAGLMTAIGWESAHVVGFSFGGMVAQELALRHPGRVRRLVLGCTSPGGAGGASYPFHEIGHLKGEARTRHLIPISDTRCDDAWAKANPEPYAQFIAMASADPYADEPGHAMGAQRQLEARATHDAWDRLSDIRSPTFIAAGRHDGIAKPETQERMAARIPDARLQFFDGGHMFVIQDRAAFRRSWSSSIRCEREDWRLRDAGVFPEWRGAVAKLRARLVLGASRFPTSWGLSSTVVISPRHVQQIKLEAHRRQGDRGR